jgi:hypothetical protein
MVSFMWQEEGVHLALYETDDLRGAGKGMLDGKTVRANIEAVRKLITDSEEHEEK